MYGSAQGSTSRPSAPRDIEVKAETGTAITAQRMQRAVSIVSTPSSTSFLSSVDEMVKDKVALAQSAARYTGERGRPEAGRKSPGRIPMTSAVSSQRGTILLFAQSVPEPIPISNERSGAILTVYNARSYAAVRTLASIGTIT